MTCVHLGKSLHIFGLTSEVSVVGAHMSLTMEYHCPSADLLYPGVFVRHEPLWPNRLCRVFLHRGLNVIRKKVWLFLHNQFRCPPEWELEERKGPKTMY